jgi:long-chain fatty acid transport protein
MLLATLALIHISRVTAIAGGFMIPHQTARGLGLSNAMTAGVNEASAVYYNPAALSEVQGDNLLGSATYVNLQNSVENSGRTSRNKNNNDFLASFFANYHIPGSDFTLGIGTYAPFGFATEYGENAFTRFAAIDTQLKTIYVTPAFAWNPLNYLSVGAGLSFVHASGVFTRALCLDPISFCTQPLGLEGRIRLTDTADAFAYNLGLLVKPLDSLKFGFSYRSRVDLRFDSGTAKFRGSFSVPTVNADVRPLPLPPVINVGLFWQIMPNWGAEFVYEYTRWSEFKNFTTTFSPTPIFLPLGAPIPGFQLPEDWKNTSTLRLGSYYALNQNWELRGGLAIEQTPIPNKTLNPAIPDADKLTLNAGVGYKWEKFSVDLGYMAVFYKTRRVTNDELEGLPATAPLFYAGAPGKDKYQAFVNFVTFSIGYRF